MPNEFEDRSRNLLGYEIPWTQINEEYITVLYNQDLLNKGFTPERIALRHNGGYAKQCGSGKTWRFGKWVYWDSCDYVAKFKAIYATL